MDAVLAAKLVVIFHVSCRESHRTLAFIPFPLAFFNSRFCLWVPRKKIQVNRLNEHLWSYSVGRRKNKGRWIHVLGLGFGKNRRRFRAESTCFSNPCSGLQPTTHRQRSVETRTPVWMSVALNSLWLKINEPINPRRDKKSNIYWNQLI